MGWTDILTNEECKTCVDSGLYACGQQGYNEPIKADYCCSEVDFLLKTCPGTSCKYYSSQGSLEEYGYCL